MQMWTRDYVGIIGLDSQSTLVVVSECARHNRKPTCCPWCVVCVGAGQLFACRRAGRGGTRTNISTTQTSLSLTTCRANTAQLEVCFLVFAYSWLRRRVIPTIANVCTHIRARVGACNLNTTPECACRVAHVYSKPDRHAFEAPRHVPAPTPLAHSCEACAGRCAMGL